MGVDKDGRPTENGPQWIGASLVPTGFAPYTRVKGSGLKPWHMEWQWEFVQMEHYLMKSLNHPQSRFFLFIVLMFRTHIKEAAMLDFAILRHHFYWMMERDPASWQDETLGDKFVRFFKSLLLRIEKKEFNNYFIRKQNMLLRLPSHAIAKAHAILFKIHENIVPNLLQAVTGLQYSKGFYPILDCDHLIQILTTDIALKLVLPKMLMTSRQSSIDSSSKKSLKSAKSAKSNKDKFQRLQEARLERLQKSKAEEQTARAQEASKRPTIDVNMAIPNVFSEARKKAVLLFFLKHYISMAKKANEFRAYGQSLMLVLQGQNLLKLLGELGYGETSECMDHQIELEKLRSIISRSGAEAYWRVNWGFDENSGDLAAGKSSSLNRAEAKHSFHGKQQLPLPDLPNRTPTPIPGTESHQARHTVVFLEVHEDPNASQQDSTDL